MLGGDTDPVLVLKGFQDPKGPWNFLLNHSRLRTTAKRLRIFTTRADVWDLQLHCKKQNEVCVSIESKN